MFCFKKLISGFLLYLKVPEKAGLEENSKWLESAKVVRTSISDSEIDSDEGYKMKLPW